MQLDKWKLKVKSHQRLDKFLTVEKWTTNSITEWIDLEVEIYQGEDGAINDITRVKALVSEWIIIKDTALMHSIQSDDQSAWGVTRQAEQLALVANRRIQTTNWTGHGVARVRQVTHSVPIAKDLVVHGVEVKCWGHNGRGKLKD